MATKTTALKNLIKATKAKARTVKPFEGANEYYKDITPIVDYFQALTEEFGSFTIKLSISEKGTVRFSKGDRFTVWANFPSTNTEIDLMVTSKLTKAMEALIGADRNLVEEFGSHEEAGIQAFQLILPLLRTVKVGLVKDGSRDSFELFR